MCTAGQRVSLTITGPGPSFPFSFVRVGSQPGGGDTGSSILTGKKYDDTAA